MFSPDSTQNEVKRVELKNEAAEPRERAFLWTFSQRMVILVLLSALLVAAVVRLLLNPTYISNPQPDYPGRAGELQDRIDPNTADWETLTALPTLGPKRAQQIIEYREQVRARDGHDIVFAKMEDLLRVKGIGVAMMNQMSPFLIFPAPPATGPAELPR